MTIDKEKLKALAESAGSDEWYAAGDLRYCDDKTGEVYGLHHDDGRFIASASPATVLALLAENERLSADCSSMRGSLKAYAASTKKLVRDGTRAARERDQLKTELAGLRTGYEAQNEVIAGLKAENEALRKECDARHPFRVEPAYADGCLVCGQWGGHGGLPCPRMAAISQQGVTHG